MILSSKREKGIFLTSMIFLLLICSLIGCVGAQGGGSLALVINPTGGPAGVDVDVSLSIPQYLSSRGLDASYASMYKGLSYSLVWDAGGSTDPPDLETVRTSTWQVIGHAQINLDGLLHGVATIPNETATVPGDYSATKPGDHLICAIYYDQSSDAPLTYFWGYFTVKSEQQLSSMLPMWLVYLIVVIIGITVSTALILYYRARRGRGI